MNRFLQARFLLLVWMHGPILSAVRSGLSSLGDHLPGGLAETRARGQPDGAAPSLAPELAFLADVVGHNRLWVIVAPSRSDSYLHMMEQQIQDMEAEGLNCQLAARDTAILTIIQNAMMEGSLRRHSPQGTATEQSLEPETVSRVLHHLELSENTFSMVILKRSLQVSARFPYPVRVQAVLETIDQMPLRKLERLTGKAPPARCKIPKKKVPLRKKIQDRDFRALRRSNITVTVGLRKPLDRQSALRSKVRDILSGRSRFVIRKGPSPPNALPSPTQRRGSETSTHKDSASTGLEDWVNGKNPAGSGAEKRGEARERSTGKPPKKGKGKKDGKKRKGKGRGRKPEQDATEKDRKALRVFLEKHQGRRRLLVITASSKEAPQYIQQRAETEMHSCELGLRKVSIITILGPERNAAVSLQHCSPGTEFCQWSASEESTNQELIAQLHREYTLPLGSFHVVLTDYDLTAQAHFNSPTTGPTLIGYIDTLPSRQPEMGRDRMAQESCPRPQDQGGSEKSLLRFVSKRRLLIISAPSEDDYSLQEQIRSLDRQACALGIRHFALMKLIGEGSSASGSVELFPLNGRSQSEIEQLATETVNGLREQLKMSRDYFSMVMVGKSGNVEAWFPAPVWSMASVYDLVDSTELRQQEQKLQSTLGIECPEDSGGSTEVIGEEHYLYSSLED